MRVVQAADSVAHGDILRLHHLTDLHIGAPDFDEHAFLERRAQIEDDENARWTFGGDLGDLIRFNDPRYDSSTLAPAYRQAADVRYATLEHGIKLFKPIAGKCLAWADGNHESAFDKHYGSKFGVEMAVALGIERLFVGYRGFVAWKITVGTRKAVVPILIDVQHGWQTGRLKGAFLVQAERELGMTEADIVLRGHNHQPNGHVFVTLGVSRHGRGRPRIVERHRSVVNGGTWRTGYVVHDPIDRELLSKAESDTWGETKGFRAEPIGGPVLELRFDQGHGEARRGTYRPATVEHRLLKGAQW